MLRVFSRNQSRVWVFFIPYGGHPPAPNNSTTKHTMTKKFLTTLAAILIAGAAGLSSVGAQSANQPNSPDQGGCTNCPQGAGEHHDGKGKGGRGHGHHDGQGGHDSGHEGGEHAPAGN